MKALEGFVAVEALDTGLVEGFPVPRHEHLGRVHEGGALGALGGKSCWASLVMQCSHHENTATAKKCHTISLEINKMFITMDDIGRSPC